MFHKMVFSTRVCFKLSAAGSGTLMDKRDSSRKPRCRQNRRTRVLLSLAVVTSIYTGLQTLVAGSGLVNNGVRNRKKNMAKENKSNLGGPHPLKASGKFSAPGHRHFFLSAQEAP